MVLLPKISAALDAAYSRDQYPAMLYQTREWEQTRPLTGLRVLDASPVFLNTTAKYRSLIAAGAELFVGISDLFPCDERVLSLLQEEHIPVVCNTDTRFPVDLVLDNAGTFSEWQARLGYVELTRSGTERYRKCPKPVFMADAGRIKRIETFLGTGESYFRAMEARGYSDWSGKKLVVFGSGKVGSGIIFYGHKFGVRVTVVTDPATLSARTRERAFEVIDFRDDAAIVATLADAFAVVTATGKRDALARAALSEALVRSPALLANIGVEDEYGAGVPAERVLAGKQTLNFSLDDPTRMEFIDATLALHSAGAVFVSKNAGKLPAGLFCPPPAIEEVLLRVSAEYGRIAGLLAEMEPDKSCFL